jgi:hypothetical protein
MWAAIIFILLGAMGVYAFGIKKKENFNTRRLRLLTNLIGAKGTRYFLLGMAGIMLFAGTTSLIRQFLFPAKKAAPATDIAHEHHQQPLAEKVADTVIEFHMLDSGMALMNHHKYQESQDIFMYMADSFPASRGFYLGLVGTDYALMKKYDTAIEYFVKGRDNGGDKSGADDNIWLASKSLYNKHKDHSYIKKYLTLCPDGNHKKEANKLLGK